MSRLARNTDPETSHIAAACVSEIANSHVAMIVNALHEHGEMTADAIASHIELDKYQICRRLPEAEEMGLVVATGRTGKTASGRPARVWGAVNGSR